MNNTRGLYNTAHPLAESGKPIFIPFGEWPYDATTRQRLDREHGEAIANELNERVARGEPGIPVYQGHPDVPDLAAKYPDKGALGWATKIALANENGKDGLALTVEWDRDPGKGFKWFSPYWFANEKDRDGQTYIVANIRSIGLVNNPNIPEFRLANEVQPEERKPMPPYQLPQKIIDLANEYDESKHPRASDGKWTSGPGGGGLVATVTKVDKTKTPAYQSEQRRNAELDKLVAHNKQMWAAVDKSNWNLDVARQKKDRAGIAKAHMDALKAGLVWDKGEKKYRLPRGTDKK